MTKPAMHPTAMEVVAGAMAAVFDPPAGARDAPAPVRGAAFDRLDALTVPPSPLGAPEEIALLRTLTPADVAAVRAEMRHAEVAALVGAGTITTRGGQP